MKNLTWQNPEQLFVAQELINKVKSKCCGIKGIYIPDMLVAIVALSNYAHQYGGKHQSTVDKWIEKASSEWIDKETGLLASFLEQENGKAQVVLPIKGSYSALNCYYLSLVAPEFARKQYELLKKNFRQDFLITGLKEYHNRTCLFGMDIDAGPIIFNLSPSGTGFVIGAATSLGDMEFRKRLLKTAEIGGSTVSWFGSSHYLLANIALVGEAIILAMRTSAPETRMCNNQKNLKSASNLNGNLNCSKELEHYAS